MTSGRAASPTAGFALTTGRAGADIRRGAGNREDSPIAHLTTSFEP
jgi:hypothetical protein